MKTQSREHAQLSSVLGVLFLLAAILACSNPAARFTKQYKCQVPGKPEPRTPYEYVERGMEHIRADEFDCALGACSEAIRLDSKLSTAYACRGGVLSNKGDYLKALKDFDQALSLQPENGDFYYSRAQVYDHMSDENPALVDLAKAVQLIKSEFGRSVAFALRGRIYQKQGKLDDSIKDYTEAIRLAPGFAYHYGNRGDVYSEKKEFEKAIGDYSEAIRLDAKNSYFHHSRAQAFVAIGKRELAAQDESIALDLSSATESTQTDASSAAPLAGGELTDKAISLPQPPYPPIARTAHASGTVVVQVVVDEAGRVTSAHALSGHPLLQAAAVAAARQARFDAKKLSGHAVTGTIRYVFGKE